MHFLSAILITPENSVARVLLGIEIFPRSCTRQKLFSQEYVSGSNLISEVKEIHIISEVTYLFKKRKKEKRERKKKRGEGRAANYLHLFSARRISFA